jgi:hypothetical protein
MVRLLLFLMLVSVFCGCADRVGRMAHPEDPRGRYRDQIAAAKRMLAQESHWADRAEWEVRKSGDGWDVIAWRVEHPERKGANRYSPWGYSVIELDSRMEPVSYQPHG